MDNSTATENANLAATHAKLAQESLLFVPAVTVLINFNRINVWKSAS